jgi:Na+-transporting NADH:ubiquinone oxidoreductase subunit NqrD
VSTKNFALFVGLLIVGYYVMGAWYSFRKRYLNIISFVPDLLSSL